MLRKMVLQALAAAVLVGTLAAGHALLDGPGSATETAFRFAQEDHDDED